VTLESLAVVVAVGPLDRAKSRLGPALDPGERRALVLAMLDDVLRAVRGVHHGALIVVTPDEDVRPLAASHDAELLPDEGLGTNAAIITAISSTTVETADGVLILQGDLPQLRIEHVSAMQQALAESKSPGALLVPNDDGGTSALGLRPPSAMPTAFGPDSGAAHRRSAEVTDVPLRELPIAALSSDVDTIEDLKLVAQIAGPATTALLERLGVEAR
jgi:2-phospho-L-lactate/phosphoenolpyruvate guanylyltransferase